MVNILYTLRDRRLFKLQTVKDDRKTTSFLSNTSKTDNESIEDTSDTICVFPGSSWQDQI